MKRLELYAAIMGLVMCAAIADAQAQQYNVTTTVVNSPGAQILVIGINKPPVPFNADNNGSAQISLPDFANNPNKTVEVTVEQCDNNPPIVYVVYAGAQPPTSKPNCRRRKPVAVYIPGSGTLLIDPAAGTATFTPSGPAAGGAPSAEKSPFTFDANILGGFVTAGNLSKASAVEGGFNLFVGPVGLGLGIVRTGDATFQNTTTGSSGSSSSQAAPTANFHAGELNGILNLFSFGPFSLAGLGGVWLFHANAAQTITITSTTPTGPVTQTITVNEEQGGNAPWFGGLARVAATKHAAVLVGVKRGFLRGGKLDQGVTMVLFGVAFYPEQWKSLIKVGSGWPPSKGW